MRKIVFILLLCLLHTCGVIAQSNALEKLSKAAIGLTKQKVVYDSTYFKQDYPYGEVHADSGCCADVVLSADNVSVRVCQSEQDEVEMQTSGEEHKKR